jgi:putative transposase
MNRPPCITGEIYHVYNRGVDKRVIYTTDDDRRYFIHLLYTLNDIHPSWNTKRVFESKRNDRGSTSIISDKSERLVDTLAFVLMPNHFHLLLQQKVDGGISKFMQKIGTGYTMLFNEKYERSGTLFQGRFKSVHITNNRQLLYIPHYIHLNPIPLMDSSCDMSPAQFLETYRWSSYLDYCGTPNFPSITKRNSILHMFGGSTTYKADALRYMARESFDVVDTSLLIDRG